MGRFYQNTGSRLPPRQTGSVHWTEERLRELASLIREKQPVKAISETLRQRWKTPVPPSAINQALRERGGRESFLARFP